MHHGLRISKLSGLTSLLYNPSKKAHMLARYGIGILQEGQAVPPSSGKNRLKSTSTPNIRRPLFQGND